MELSGHTYVEDDWRTWTIMAVHTHHLDVIEDAEDQRFLRTLNRFLFEQAITNGEIKEVTID